MKAYSIQTPDDGLIAVVSSRKKVAEYIANSFDLPYEQVKDDLAKQFKDSLFAAILVEDYRTVDVTEWEV